jgi:hypothetical protein
MDGGGRKVPTKLKNVINKPAGVLAAIAIATTAGGAATAIASGGPAAGAPSIGGKTSIERTADAESSLTAGAGALRSQIAGVDARRAAEQRKERALEKRRERKREAAKPEFGTPASVGVDQSTLDSIAACESGGDPTAVDPSGTYRGKYQFDMQTWASMGGSGDPAAAPEAEQDYRAAMLLAQSGSSPWPVCGS